jgi:hypothetical protein
MGFIIDSMIYATPFNLKFEYTYMKPVKLLCILIVVFCAGCTKSGDSTPTNPFGGDKGQETLWASHANLADFPIDISVNGTYVGTIGGPLSATPDCQQATDKVVKFDAEPGTYNMVGKAASGGNWTGTFTITSGSCNTAPLE